MLRRAFAFALACLLLWAATSTLEGWNEAGSSVSVAGASEPGNLVKPGSVEHHHLDDQPAQPLTELAADLPGLLLACLPTPPDQPAAEHHAPAAEACGLPPYLDGLQRPPAAVA